MPHSPMSLIIARGGSVPPLTHDDRGCIVEAVAWCWITSHGEWPSHGRWYALDGQGAGWLWQEVGLGDVIALRIVDRSDMMEQIAHELLAVCVWHGEHHLELRAGVTLDEARHLQSELRVTCAPARLCDRVARRFKRAWKGC